MRDNKAIGRTLRGCRQSSGKSIRAVALAVKMEAAVLSRIEHGINRISFENAIVLCEYYSLPLTRLAISTRRKGNSHGKS